MIEPTDLPGVEEVLALHIIAHAVSIAPGLDSIPADTPRRARAIAILQGVAKEARSRGSRLVRNQGIGPASIGYRDVDSWFSEDDRRGLRASCTAVAEPAAPIGSFPKPGIVARIWSEGDYS